METKPGYYFKKISEFNFPDIFAVKNVWETLEKKNEFLKDKDTVIDPTTKIKEGVVIEGPVYIGKNCTIGPHAYIRKNTIIGDNCKIGRMEIKSSIIMNNVKAHHTGYIGDSIIGEGTNIGAGVVLTNYKLGGRVIKLGDIELGKKFGAVIGDHTSIGCNTTTMPGTFIGHNVWIYPLCTVNGFVPENTIVKHKQPHEVVEKK